MNNRLELQEKLEQLLGSRNVYYQPPETVKMKYPAIVYSRSSIRTDHADNSVYLHKTAYQLTYIDKDPDSDMIETLVQLPLCRFDRHFTAENLNHDVFTIFY